uniref:Uncharacterized protein n=1 Tax=uncultured Alphaproteobacteria bacterium TaxID=91750 RepID=A0A6G8F266_9PROT|nr:hypothetical protein PlAlph_0120 [uncultured Alphaproteobacteria bacterium]
MLRYVIIISLIAVAVNAEEIIDSFSQPNNETIIYGQAANANGTVNKVTIEQPADAGNPLGDPVPDYTPPTKQPLRRGQKSEVAPANAAATSEDNAISQISPQNPSDSQMTPQQMNNEIQNKLYEEGNRVYDVQSYPIDDIGYMNENGQDNAVTNYPAY